MRETQREGPVESPVACTHRLQSTFSFAFFFFFFFFLNLLLLLLLLLLSTRSSVRRLGVCENDSEREEEVSVEDIICVSVFPLSLCSYFDFNEGISVYTG